MWRTIATLFVWLLVVVFAIGTVFFVGDTEEVPAGAEHRSPIQPGLREPAPDEDGRDAGSVRLSHPTPAAGSRDDRTRRRSYPSRPSTGS